MILDFIGELNSIKIAYHFGKVKTAIFTGKDLKSKEERDTLKQRITSFKPNLMYTESPASLDPSNLEDSVIKAEAVLS